MERADFLKHLRRSRLLTEGQVEGYADRFPERNQARAMASALVAEGVLTRFQARKLLEGKAGWLVLGQYRILDRLGQGGMAHVFKAVHTAMERVVALKIVLPSLLKDPQALELFRREVRAAAQLHHPHIVTAYDAGELRGLHYLVLEYVEGINLFKLVQQRGPLPPGLACTIIRQTALALQHAFDKGMVHRDIKPANLLICQAEEASDLPAVPVVKVFDFGLARLTSTAVAKAVETIMVESGTILGTLDYISPEQAHDVHGVDIRSDLYSLGCTFYYALTGQVPFPGNPMEKLVRHLMREPQPVQELRPEIPDALAAIVQKLMAKEKERRFQTPIELVRALASWSEPSRPEAVSLPAPLSAPVQPIEIETQPERESEGSAEPALSQAESNTVRILADAKTTSPAREEPPAESRVPPLDEASFRVAWRRWAGIIEYIVRGKGTASSINLEAFKALHKQLSRGISTLIASSEGDRHDFFRGLEFLVRPWMTPEILAKTDPELLFDLFERCQRAAVEIDLLMGVLQELPAETPTGLGGIFARFRARQQRNDFSAEMQRVFGVKL